MGLKLSIIVPVYNVEKYLRKCVDSLLDQDLSPEVYEIILVDDGSTDHSGEICDEYVDCHSNVKVIHQQNGGLSAARNSGIETAKGKYVQFVDSDDYLEPNVLKTLVEKMERDRLDVLRFNYRNVNEQYEVVEPNKDPKRFVSYLDEVCDGMTFLNERLGPACYACQFMVCRELLADCQFKEGIYFKDTEWTPRLLLKSNRVTSMDLMVYNYLIRQGSITKSIDDAKKKKVLQDLMLAIDRFKQMETSVEDGRWFSGMISGMVLSIVNYVVANCYGERKRVIMQLRSKDLFPLSVYQEKKSNVRKIRIANISIQLLFFVVHLKSKVK